MPPSEQPTKTVLPRRAKINLTVIAVTIALLLVACGSIAYDAVVGSDEPSESETASDRCSTFGDNVEAYDILVPGASRAEYLTLLHKFQRDCGDEAEARGLTNEGAPQCERLDQENCTMWLPTP